MTGMATLLIINTETTAKLYDTSDEEYSCKTITNDIIDEARMADADKVAWEKDVNRLVLTTYSQASRRGKCHGGPRLYNPHNYGKCS